MSRLSTRCARRSLQAAASVRRELALPPALRLRAEELLHCGNRFLCRRPPHRGERHRFARRERNLRKGLIATIRGCRSHENLDPRDVGERYIDNFSRPKQRHAGELGASGGSIEVTVCGIEVRKAQAESEPLRAFLQEFHQPHHFPDAQTRKSRQVILSHGRPAIAADPPHCGNAATFMSGHFPAATAASGRAASRPSCRR
jgi:hypothetical protein